MALLDWSCYRNTGSDWNFIIVGTSLDEGPDRKFGRVLFLQVKKNESGVFKIKTVKILKFTTPVYALAAFRPNELLISHGKRIELHRITIDDAPIKPRYVDCVEYAACV